MKLIIEDENGRRSVVPLDLGEVTVGRHEANTIRLNERNVSRHHARFVRENGSVYAEDLDSYNGVFVNGDRVKRRQDLRAGDVVSVGDFQLELRGNALDGANGDPLDIDELETTKPSFRFEDDETVDHSFRDKTDADELEPRAESTALIRFDQIEETEIVASRRPLTGAKARLICVSTQYAGQEFGIDREETVIGRTDDNDIVVDHRSVSRHHAKIVVEGSSYHIVDMKSANGTLVNGEEYVQIELKPADLIELGHVRLRFVPPGEVYQLSAEEKHAVSQAKDAKRGFSRLHTDPALFEQQRFARQPTNPGDNDLAIAIGRRGWLGGWRYVALGLAVFLLSAASLYWLTRGEDDLASDGFSERAEEGRLNVLIDRMDTAVADMNWGAAKQLAETALLLDFENARAQRVIERADEELRARDVYDRAVDLASDEQWEEALRILDDVPEDSALSSNAETLRRQAEGAIKSVVLADRAEESLQAKRYDDAEKLAKELMEFDETRAKELLRRVTEGRSARRAPRNRTVRQVRVPKNGESTNKTENSRQDSNPAPRPPAARPKTPADFLKEAVVLIKSNQAEKALKPLQECVRANTRYCLCYRALGIAHAKLKNNPKAARNYRTFIELCPNHEEVPQIRQYLGE